MFTLTGFGDEISPKLDEQMQVLASEGIRYIELRGVENKNVTVLSEAELSDVRAGLDRKGFKISAIGSPIGKVRIDEDFEAHLKLFEHCLDLADFFGTPFIRIFSYYPPEGQKIARFREEVLRRMQQKTEMAARRGKILLHENEHAIYGETAERCRDIHAGIRSPHLRATFDFANFVLDGEDPLQAFTLLRDYVGYVHVKDALRPSKDHGDPGRMVPPGEGDGQIEPILRQLAGDGKDYFLSLEPHLSFAGSMYGHSGPDLFTLAIRALKKILTNIGAKWR